MAADRDDDGVAGEAPTVRYLDGVVVDAPRRTGVLHQFDTAGGDVVTHPFDVVGVVRDPGGVRDGRLDIHLRRGPAQAEGLPGLRVPGQPRRPGQGADGCGALVDAGAAHPLAF